jgi:hypothetical protein
MNIAAQVKLKQSTLPGEPFYHIHGFRSVTRPANQPKGKASANLNFAKSPISAIEKSRRRAVSNTQIGETLGEIAHSCGDTKAEVTADLLKLSGYAKACGELTNLVDKKGRVFTCPQSLISANTRLDPNYQIRTARRHRKRIYETFAAHLPDIVEHNLRVAFLTPTYPNLLGVGFADNDRFQARAWELFLQTKVFGDFFYAGFSKTEWTSGNKGERARTGRAFDLNLDGINYHFHILCIIYKLFADGETSALENRLAYLLKDPDASPEEKRLIRNSLRLITAWTKCLKKAHREIFGKPLRVNTKSGRVRFTFSTVGVEEIKAYDPDESRDGIFWEIAKAASYTAKGASFDQLPPDLLLEAENVFRGKRIINPFGAFRKYAEPKEITSQALVKQSTKQSGKQHRPTSNLLFDNVLRGENEPLKSYGIRLCSQGLRSTWVRYLELNKDLIIAKLRDALLERFPNSIFKDLSGKSYYGWKAERELRQKSKESKPGYNPASDNYQLFKAYQAQYLALDYTFTQNV